MDSPTPRLSRIDRLRLISGALILCLGIVIIVQGVRLLLPWPHTLAGVLMVVLANYRLWLARLLWYRMTRSEREAPRAVRRHVRRRSRRG